MIKDKTSKAYLSALQRVIDFYIQYGYSVCTIRCDAGSTEADTEVIRTLNKDHHNHVHPIAVKHQNQNPVEPNSWSRMSYGGPAASQKQTVVPCSSGLDSYDELSSSFK